MSAVLGIDTSNYTTSAAVFDRGALALRQEKRLLEVPEGQKGLRQSDALFQHVRQLPEVLERLLDGGEDRLSGVAASDRPCGRPGSYMPCFLAGVGAARQIAAALRVPVLFFTHQQGHVAAALYGARCLSLMEERFLAFHVSGGTTQALLVRPDGQGSLLCEEVARSRDLKAGQLIDRVGIRLGLSFPAGPALEQLALQAARSPRIKACLAGADCHLSGIENQCAALLEKGAPPSEVALFCLKSVEAALDGMTAALLRQYGSLPLVYAGGVMSNRLIRAHLETQYGGRFAPPAFSSDNAAGIALLADRVLQRRG